MKQGYLVLLFFLCVTKNICAADVRRCIEHFRNVSQRVTPGAFNDVANYIRHPRNYSNPALVEQRKTLRPLYAARVRALFALYEIVQEKKRSAAQTTLSEILHVLMDKEYCHVRHLLEADDHFADAAVQLIQAELPGLLGLYKSQ